MSIDQTMHLIQYTLRLQTHNIGSTAISILFYAPHSLLSTGQNGERDQTVNGYL